MVALNVVQLEPRQCQCPSFTVHKNLLSLLRSDDMCMANMCHVVLPKARIEGINLISLDTYEQKGNSYSFINTSQVEPFRFSSFLAGFESPSL
jgi:hypothetical protein